MTSQPNEDDGGTVPVACTLTQVDLAAQTGRWQQLATRAMTERAETADGLRLSFQLRPGVEEELRTLVAVENECCPWADWTVDSDDEQIVLDVRSAREGVTALHSMFTSLQPNPAAWIDGLSDDRKPPGGPLLPVAELRRR